MVVKKWYKMVRKWYKLVEPTFPALLVNPVSLSSKTPWLSSAETAEATAATAADSTKAKMVLDETILLLVEVEVDGSESGCQDVDNVGCRLA